MFLVHRYLAPHMQIDPEVFEGWLHFEVPWEGYVYTKVCCDIWLNGQKSSGQSPVSFWKLQPNPRCVTEVQRLNMQPIQSDFIFFLTKKYVGQLSMTVMKYVT